jgi:GrpB-like predicted nucleotidyltransferase (UPF0157 family)
MIGLKRGTVKLVPHDVRWHASFEREKKMLLKNIGDVAIDIQHVGSTAVKGISAKPIIDISVGVNKLSDVKKLIKPLSRAGYHLYDTHRDRIFFAKGPERRRTHHLHVVHYNGAKWKSDMLFRDYLSEHPVRAKAYANLKIKLAKKYSEDREKYTAGKGQFIKATLKLAKRK